MADRKISDLTALTTPATGDLLPIVDISEAAAADKNKSITVGELLRGAPDGTAAAPGIAFESDPNSGIYSPGADQVAISTGGTGRLFVDASGRVGIGKAVPTQTLHIAANAPYIEFEDIDNNQDWQIQATAWFALRNQTSATELLRIDTSGRVGIGTSSPSANLESQGNVSSTTQFSGFQGLRIQNANGSAFGVSADINFVAGTGTDNRGAVIGAVYESGAGGNDLYFATNGSAVTSNDTPTEKMRITAAGNVGIGTTSPVSDAVLTLSTDSDTALFFRRGSGTNQDGAIRFEGGDFQFLNGANSSTVAGLSERMRIDSAGRLLVGTSSATSAGSTNYAKFYIKGDETSQNNAALQVLWKGSTPSSGDLLGRTVFAAGTSGAPGAYIDAYADGEWFSGGDTTDQPSRLVFSTTADGASSPTERMRITSEGTVYADSGTSAGFIAGNTTFFSVGSSSETGNFIRGGNEAAVFVRSSATPLYAGRQGTDGELVGLYHAGIKEGSISVSGTTVSYNGAHLARWSQLPGGVERTEILRGSVLSNIDEMCNWGEEENEQLNRMQVSNVEGDKNVSGVFQAWDDDDDTYTNDFYCAMTGDFVIRIAQGVTVERGDLLMSAGDGTAKPQEDDIIRSKTIAKVTSTNVSCTYDDGSYCVPCVLMAC